MDAKAEQASVVVRRRVRPDRVDAYEKWLTGVIEAASTFEGHQGAQVLRPQDPANQDYVLLFRYETPEQLAAWRTSDTARDWLERGKALTVGEVQIQTLTGLEFWFHLPETAGHGPPPRHKMAVATVVGLYPLIVFVAPQLAKLFAPMPAALATLSSVSVLVLLMTYAVMPWVTRGLSRWLFPR